MSNYTLEEIVLPLSLDKEYILVDKQGYLGKNVNNQLIIRDFVIDAPFKLNDVDIHANGYIDSDCIILVDTELQYFREVVRSELPSTQEPTFEKDIFSEMLTLAKENQLLIQFDGCTQDKNDVIIVTPLRSDIEYQVSSKEDFDKLLSSIKTLEKFERS